MSDILSVPLPAEVPHRRATCFHLHSKSHLAEVLASEWSFWTEITYEVRLATFRSRAYLSISLIGSVSMSKGEIA